MSDQLRCDILNAVFDIFEEDYEKICSRALDILRCFEGLDQEFIEIFGIYSLVDIFAKPYEGRHIQTSMPHVDANYKREIFNQVSDLNLGNSREIDSILDFFGRLDQKFMDAFSVDSLILMFKGAKYTPSCLRTYQNLDVDGIIEKFTAYLDQHQDDLENATTALGNTSFDNDGELQFPS